MPLLEPVKSFYVEEWKHAMKGLHGLTPAGQEELRLKAYQYGRIPGQPRTVSGPGWDDAAVISIPEKLPPELIAAHYRALRAGEPSPLTPQQLADYTERTERGKRIATSASPEYVNAMGQVLQSVDAVQRSLVELGVVGRLALWPIRRTLEALLPGVSGQALTEIGQAAGRAAAADIVSTLSTAGAAGLTGEARAAYLQGFLRAGEREALHAAEDAAARFAFREATGVAAVGLGARIGARLLGPIGWIFIAADVLQMLFYLGQSLLPFYALLCRSPAEALAAAAAGIASGGIPVRRLLVNGGEPANGLKGRMEGLASVNPFSSEFRAIIERKALRLLPNLHEGIKAFHLGHEATGYGLAFGAIFGFYAEAAYGVALAAQGEPVTFQAPRGLLQTVGVTAGWVALQRESLPLAAFAGGTWLFHQLGKYSGVELKAKQDAARVLQQGIVGLGAQEVFTEQEHARHLAALIYALDLVSEDFIDQPWDDSMDAFINRPLAPPVSMDFDTAELLRYLNVDPDTLDRWPVPGNPKTLTPQQLVDHCITRIPRTIEQLMAPRRSELSGQFLGCLLSHVRDRCYRLWVGNTTDVKRQWTPEWRLIISLARHRRVPILTPPYDKALRFWDEALAELKARDKTGFMPDELDQLFSRADCPYIQVI